MTEHDRRVRRQLTVRRLLPLVPSVLFLAFFLVPVLAEASSTGEVAAAIAVVVVISAGFLGIAPMTVRSEKAKSAYLVGFSVVLLGLPWPLAGSWTLAMAPYALIAAALLLPWTPARIVIPTAVAATAVGGFVIGQWWIVLVAVMGGGIALSMSFAIRSGQLRDELSAAEDRIATLAVAAERERIARDLHDILGHSLTAVVVKAGLAVRLAESQPDLARENMAEVEEIARTALSDVRATATGFRQVRLATELAGARSVLAAADISATTPEALPPLSDQLSEFFGWVVREGVTNVVRHSGARHCTISVSAESVTITDDGPHHCPYEIGNGLTGLTERADQLGARVTVSAAEPHGTTLVATAEGDPR